MLSALPLFAADADERDGEGELAVPLRLRVEPSLHGVEHPLTIGLIEDAQEPGEEREAYDEMAQQGGAARANIRFPPQSTFKIPNTLIALDSKVADGPNVIIKSRLTTQMLQELGVWI